MEIQKEKTPGQNKPASETAFVGINGEVTGLGFAVRDQGAKNEEDQGLLEFKVIRNDRKHESMEILIDLKNIFSRQLPKMPKEYIVKLVFDRNHESMIILRNGNKLIGGTCFRHYPQQKFAEVAFLAITATEQVQGYGTRLMNKFKEEMQQRGVEYLLTYADNFAIGYFKKQGFSKECKMPQEDWKGFIKDYDGGTMMECKIHPFIDYSNISNIIKKQKSFVIDTVKKLCINNRRFDGSIMEDLYNNNYNQDEEKGPRINPEKIPGIVPSGWTWQDYFDLQKTKEHSFVLKCQNIIENMRKHQNSWPFIEPVVKDDVPDYYDCIQDPIDIKTIEKQLNANQYDKDSFIKDVQRIFSNCQTYNQPDTIYYQAAVDLEEFITPALNQLRDMQMKEDNLGTFARQKGKQLAK